MFLVKAGTVIQVETPKAEKGWFYWSGWQPYTTTEDRLYDKHEVWDRITVTNGMVDVPEWARRNIMEFNKVIISAKNKKGVTKYGMVNQGEIEFVD